MDFFGEGQLWPGKSVRMAELQLLRDFSMQVRIISQLQGPQGKYPLNLQLNRQDDTYFFFL